MHTQSDRGSYYRASANRVSAYPSLKGDIKADVCVIGGGYTGLSAALQLREHGLSVALLEAESIGWGASGRNGGQVCQGLNMAHEDLAAKVGRPTADALWQMSLDSVELVRTLINKHQIDCDLKHGVLHVAAKPGHSADIEAAVAYKQEVLGYQDVAYIKPADVQEMLGTERYYGGEHFTNALHLHPLNYALGLATAAEQAGVQLYEHSRVTDYQSGRTTQVSTSAGNVSCQYILLACNGYLGPLEKRIAGKIMPINNFILATEPLPDHLVQRINRADVAVADSRFVINYFRLSGDNRLLWGGGETYTSRFPSDIRAFVQQHMLALYPELAQYRIDYGWGGTLAITLNRMPHFERVDQSLFVAHGYSGHGVALATLGGKLMADALAGSAQGFDQFAAVPTPSFPGGTLLRWPGLVAGMLYYSLRDRFF
ncbi:MULTISPECIES: FAD-binding oxidoreductase [unclassified Oceanobacter]|uniref:NAD(P)/FAD-dependent oxidoreductase n=1 Tax=unclassified Oceanobacter TaxID=2620260 RepID=UPI00273567CD|nr:MULTISPECIES: FAD-binding oxidoreductase [unclassified Oceanobacter]MDP2607800.1 FAD-binding oxidoreductase [Oceanobacter sp. 1_MG-2023]MDP2611016.1 FAD-binding oxidoreductase [Oceanobacter sp. 2_MG-2023]